MVGLESECLAQGFFRLGQLAHLQLDQSEIGLHVPPERSVGGVASSDACPLGDRMGKSLLRCHWNATSPRERSDVSSIGRLILVARRNLVSVALALSGTALAAGEHQSRFPAQNPRLAPCGSLCLGQSQVPLGSGLVVKRPQADSAVASLVATKTRRTSNRHKAKFSIGLSLVQP